MDRRAKNAGILSSGEYSYVYSPTSKVFHRPNCHLMLNVIDVKGCTYYQEAINGRVPCKVCHPEPNEWPKKTAVKRKREEATLPQQAKTQVKNTQEKVTLLQPAEKKVIAARLLGDKWIRINNVKIVGYCHNLIHPGKLTRRLMEEHDCLGKNCRFFEKNNESTYWVAEENRKRQKEQRKQIQQAEKKAAQELEDELTELKDLFQSYADDAGYSMLIVRLEKERPNRYRVFYVSENPFADGNRFPNFLSTIKFFFPRVSINLRHIRDVDGHFVTIDEYLARKR